MDLYRSWNFRLEILAQTPASRKQGMKTAVLCLALPLNGEATFSTLMTNKKHLARLAQQLIKSMSSRRQQSHLKVYYLSTWRLIRI